MTAEWMHPQRTQIGRVWTLQLLWQRESTVSFGGWKGCGADLFCQIQGWKSGAILEARQTV